MFKNINFVPTIKRIDSWENKVHFTRFLAVAGIFLDQATIYSEYKIIEKNINNKSFIFTKAALARMLQENLAIMIAFIKNKLTDDEVSFFLRNVNTGHENVVLSVLGKAELERRKFFDNGSRHSYFIKNCLGEEELKFYSLFSYRIHSSSSTVTSHSRSIKDYMGELSSITADKIEEYCTKSIQVTEDYIDNLQKPLKWLKP